MKANRGHCTCKGYWDECAYCRSLEDQRTPEPESAGDGTGDGSDHQARDGGASA